MIASVVDKVLDEMVLGFASPGLALRSRLSDWPADPAPDALTGRRVVVTGASSGIGERTAAALAKLGADVDLVVRDLAKGQPIADRIDEESGRTAARLWRCDVADPVQARSCGRAIAGEGEVHAVIHNAGVLPPQRSTSPDGHEMTMAVHVLGPMRLTDELASAFTDDSRIVFVTSGGMYTQKLPVDDPDFQRGDYSGTTAYARSKRTQVDLLPHLQRHWADSGAAVYAMHPGWVDTPGLSSSLPGFRRITKPVLRDADQGADTIVWLAATEPRPVGATFWHDRRQRPTHRLGRTRSTQEQIDTMWKWVRDAAQQ